MTDRFKFRVWDKDFKRYWTDEEIKENAAWLLFPYNDNIENIEIEQCTGLKDKNGNLIYEGDLIGGVFDGSYVGYCNKCKSFELFVRGECMRCFDDLYWSLVVKEDGNLEVIGNIHKNPESLK